MTTATTPRVDIYTRVTAHIIEELERGVRPWLKPWYVEHAAGPGHHTSRPLLNRRKRRWRELNTPNCSQCFGCRSASNLIAKMPYSR